MSKERRLIDANALELATYHIAQESEYARGWNDALYAAMINAPTIDAVLVIRCRECKYSHEDEIFGNRWCESHYGCRKVKDEGFCDLGERKEGADNA